MSLKIDTNKSAVAYHIKDGETTFNYAVDAHQAVSRFPAQWRWKPDFSQAEVDAYLKAEVDAANAQAEISGKPEDRARAAALARDNEVKAEQFAAQPPVSTLIEIPDGWQDLRPIERINLAASLGEPRKGLTAAKADEAIQAEVDRREAEPADQPAPAKPFTPKVVDTAAKPAASTDPNTQPAKPQPVV